MATLVDEEKKAERFSISEPKLDLEIGDVHDLDEAEIFLRDNGYGPERLQELLSDEAGVKRLIRRVDLRLLPLLAGTYVLQYIDKQALSYAAVFDLFSDTGINQNQYSWFPSMFYLAYLVAEYPWSALAQRTYMAKVVSGCVVVWGAILMLTATSSNFAGMATCRTLLGVFEAPITPCFMMIVSMWYMRDEQPFRAGVFYSCNGVGAMIGGILSYCIGQIDTFPVWKAIFLLCGGLTVIWGVVMYFFLPDDIMSARQFSVEDKATLIARGKVGRTGILSRKIKWSQMREAFLDPQVWLLFLFTLLNEVINGGIANFGKLIIKGLVHDALRTTALGIPLGAFQIVWILSGTYIASRFRNVRTFVMMAYLVPTIIGVALMWKLDRHHQKVGVLFGYYISGAYVASLVVTLQMPAANLAGYTKRTTGTAIVFAAYCIGNVIGPHAFLDSEAPIYQTGCKVCMACAICQVVVAVCLRVLLVWRNKQKDVAQGAVALDDPVVDELTNDITDFENPRFRYML
ncbi:major facilitator superfamily transporter [Grosmannia clavigera kw1407]|uniref:Major facilitator superfamily transporter n=1 Tax=Grosmannia clavigera (strain kw1407 / UAMH 11150) TaxID=655863 RepID=F0XQC6_GROCL|nr:major facilitator superfamily transporter [Grosmannia clavigera kw1407]EFX00679.1 major facilitator superfamily transporter [Grosmannia clavigera kw1407]